MFDYISFPQRHSGRNGVTELTTIHVADWMALA
jgi:hypothetical protein